MITLQQIANEVTWHQQETSKCSYQQQDTRKRLLILNLNEPPKIVQALMTISRFVASDEVVDYYDFCLNFTANPSEFFHISKTPYIRYVLYVPEVSALQANGTLKKTLWQYMQRIGMIDFI